MDINLLEQLLNESESAYLDFKQEQYKFVSADDSSKSELLKDILAFTNAWRRTDAFILIGVEEVKGGKSKVIGVNEHIDDHSLQQFVNSKTQEPITFSYTPFEYSGKQIGIIRIPVQKRPIYLVRKFGKLGRNLVYLRRGSSTDIASPDEIAKMGAASLPEFTQPTIDLQFADIHKRELLSHEIELTSTVLKIPNRENIPDFSPQRDLFDMSSLGSEPIKSYYRQLVSYYEDQILINPVSFSVMNFGQVTAQNVRLLITKKHDTNIKIFSEDDLPSVPRPYINLALPLDNSWQNSSVTRHSNLELSFHGNKWNLEIIFGNVQAKAFAWADEVIYIGCLEEKIAAFKGQIFADNLSEPISVPLEISFLTKTFQSDIQSIEKLVEEEQRKQLEELFGDEF